MYRERKRERLEKETKETMRKTERERERKRERQRESLLWTQDSGADRPRSQSIWPVRGGCPGGGSWEG